MKQSQAIELAAQAAHETNRVWCLTAFADRADPLKLVSSHWEDLPDWHQNSLKSGVKIAIEKSVAGEPTPEEMHESWMAYKLQDGWTFGPEPDSLLKQHPCLVPYEDLPSRERIKDTLFLKTVRLILLGLRSEFGEFEVD